MQSSRAVCNYMLDKTMGFYVSGFCFASFLCYALVGSLGVFSVSDF